MFGYGNYNFPYYEGIYAYTQPFLNNKDINFPQADIRNDSTEDEIFVDSETKKEDSYEKLSEEDRQMISELKSIDLRIRAHEMAHVAVGGNLAGSASFSYTTGPDGTQYAIAGEVPIAIKTGNTPDETMQIARQIKAAALAPSDPSSQDRSVAATADKLYSSAASEAYKSSMKLVTISKQGFLGNFLSFYS